VCLSFSRLVDRREILRASGNETAVALVCQRGLKDAVCQILRLELIVRSCSYGTSAALENYLRPCDTGIDERFRQQVNLMNVAISHAVAFLRQSFVVLHAARRLEEQRHASVT